VIPQESLFPLLDYLYWLRRHRSNLRKILWSNHLKHLSSLSLSRQRRSDESMEYWRILAGWAVRHPHVTAAHSGKLASSCWLHQQVYFYSVTRVFLRRFRYPIRVPRISNRVPRIRENYHRVPKNQRNRVPTDPYRVPNIFLKKNWYNHAEARPYDCISSWIPLPTSNM